VEHEMPGKEITLDTKTITFNKLASEYDLWFEDPGKIIFDIEVRAFQEIMPVLPEPWLEIGVGSGRFAQALGIKKGIDPATKLLKIAKSRGIDVSLSNGEKCPFEKGSFGTVFMIVTFCFVDSPGLVLKEARRILASAGKIVLGLVLRESPWGEFYRQKKQEGHRFYKHATFYKYDEVVALLAQAGFSIEKVVSKLFQKSQKVKDIESPREGYDPNAGFTIIVAGGGIT
jgi:SAM-dependent methyltransferase